MARTGNGETTSGDAHADTLCMIVVVGLLLTATSCAAFVYHLRDVLHARGYDIEYWEFAGTHSDLSWQDGLARGLAVLLGANATER